jgi:hypothetical protein
MNHQVKDLVELVDSIVTFLTIRVKCNVFEATTFGLAVIHHVDRVSVDWCCRTTQLLFSNSKPPLVSAQINTTTPHPFLA